MASVRIVDCPACGASEFVIRVYGDEVPLTTVDCSDCGFQLVEMRAALALGLEAEVPLTVSDEPPEMPGRSLTWGRY